MPADSVNAVAMNVSNRDLDRKKIAPVIVEFIASDTMRVYLSPYASAISFVVLL